MVIVIGAVSMAVMLLLMVMMVVVVIVIVVTGTIERIVPASVVFVGASLFGHVDSQASVANFHVLA